MPYNMALAEAGRVATCEHINNSDIINNIIWVIWVTSSVCVVILCYWLYDYIRCKQLNSTKRMRIHLTKKKNNAHVK